MGRVPLWKAAFNFCMQDKRMESLATKCSVAVITGTEEIRLCRLSGEYNMGQTGKDVVILWKNLIHQKFKHRKDGWWCFFPRELLSASLQGWKGTDIFGKRTSFLPCKDWLSRPVPYASVSYQVSLPHLNSCLHSSYAPLHTSPSSNS